MIKCMQLIALVMILSSGSQAQSKYSWLKAAHWDSGLAEVCIYGGQEKRYGAMRKSRVELVTVREFFDPEKNVKTARGESEQSIPVLKQNWTRVTRTGVYEYNQMASVFLHRETGALQKMSMVSMEWCGNSSALVEPNDQGGFNFSIHSYFDEMGKQIGQLKGNDFILHEALLPYLRENLPYLERGSPIKLAKPLLSHKPSMELFNRGAIYDISSISYPFEGKAHPCIKVVVSTDSVENRETFIISTDEHRRLFAWEGRGGEYLKLYKVQSMDYWNLTNPGDEVLLK